MKPLPDNLPPLPEGYVYLGTGRTFKTKGAFLGLTYGAGKWIESHRYNGKFAGYHYAAPDDSEIARLNAEPERPRIEMGKTYRYRGGYNARVLCVDAPGEYPVISIRDCGRIHLHYADGQWADTRGETHNDLIEVREPREWWVNIDYDGLEFFYPTKEEADQDRNEDHKECILVREVREEGPDEP